MQQNRPDSILIEAILKGERQAFHILTERYRRYVYQTAYRVLENRDDAHDVTQEVFVYVFQRLPSLREPDRFGGWVRALTLTLCADYRRRRGSRRLGVPLTEMNERGEETNLLERIAVRDAVAHLPTAQQTTLLLRYVGGWSEQEVANLLHLSVNTVRSRLLAAKRRLRSDLGTMVTRSVTETKEKADLNRILTNRLTEQHTAMLSRVFPKSRLVEVTPEPETWMPFAFRILLELPNRQRKSVDIRQDIIPDRLPLLEFLERHGIPVAPRLSAPELLPDGSFATLTETPAGENLMDWALGGTPHRLRIATERGLEGIDRLQAVTEALEDSPIGQDLPHLTLLDEWDALQAKGGAHLQDPWFKDKMHKLESLLADINAPLLYTNYLHFFPNWLRVDLELEDLNEPVGYPGDLRLKANPISEFIAPYGHFGDPLLGLSMVWIYDCYPIVHAGFVEQYLWRKGVSRREFAPRLALQSLKIIQRELPVERPPDPEAYYYDALHAYVEQAFSWA